ncbi:MAG: tRNA epoxyqueuosine(34) reductase QueG [Fusobacteriota bacterium]
MAEPKNNLKNILKEYNLDTYGITNVSDFSYLKDIFKEKKSKDGFADFDEMDFQKRANLNNILPGIKSIISIAFPYKTSKDTFKNKNYNISSYAIRPDYHYTVKKILTDVINNLKNIYPNNKFDIYVDSNPLFEKEIAMKSGIGSYGKNSLLYTEKYGSYFFLAEIITDLFIDGNDYAFSENCINCNKCVDECPNGAILDGKLNAKKCIAYLTNTKKDIDPKKVYDNLWGCDICQDVCPQNQNISYSKIKYFEPIEDIFLPLEEIIFKSNNKIRKYYNKSAIGWTGPNILKRNAIIIMGNSLDKKYIPFLKKFITTSNNDMLVSYAQKSLDNLYN